MTYFQILTEEHKQLVRKPHKLFALIVFAMTFVLSIFQGVDFYQKRQIEIERVDLKNQELRIQALKWYKKGELGPQKKPWVNIEKPFWAIWYATPHEFDKPSPLSILSMGQSEQFAFYTRVGVWSTGYDLDLIGEIHNPEFIGVDSLDFSFVWLYLLPILLIVLLYDIKGLEYDLGFLKSIRIYCSNTNKWFLSRVSYYLMIVTSMLALAMLSSLIMLDTKIGETFIFFAYCLSYCLIWFAVYFIVIIFGKGQTDQAIKMLLIWLSFAVIIPGAIHQYLTLKHPPSYMLDWVTTMREGSDEILALPLEETKKKLSQHPVLLNNNLEIDNASEIHLSSLNRLLWSLEMQKVTNKIMTKLEIKNKAIKNLSLVSPIIWFQNKLNHLSGTDYYANQRFRQRIQKSALKINLMALEDLLNDSKVNEDRFKKYIDTNSK